MNSAHETNKDYQHVSTLSTAVQGPSAQGGDKNNPLGSRCGLDFMISILFDYI